MTRPARVLPYISNNSILPSYNYADLADVPEWEFDSWEHWCFDTGASSGLTGRVNRRPLTLQGAAPAYSADHVTLGGQGNALLSDMDESHTWSICMVAKYPVTASVFAGTSDNATNKGSSLELRVGGSVGEVNADVEGMTPSEYRNLDISPSPTPGSIWLFAAMALDFAPGPLRRLYASGQYDQFTGDTGTHTLNGKIAIGNKSKTTSLGASIEIAEAILYNRVLSLAEMQTIHARSRLRAARRGIVIS